jgi:hypothetical protein
MPREHFNEAKEYRLLEKLGRHWIAKTSCRVKFEVMFDQARDFSYSQAFNEISLFGNGKNIYYKISPSSILKNRHKQFNVTEINTVYPMREAEQYLMDSLRWFFGKGYMSDFYIGHRSMIEEPDNEKEICQMGEYFSEGQVTSRAILLALRGLVKELGDEDIFLYSCISRESLSNSPRGMDLARELPVELLEAI